MQPISKWHCRSCSSQWYLDALNCRACGSSDIEQQPLRGHGVLRASTTVHRAPAKEMQHLAPYTVCLVKMDDGFTVAGHLADDAEPGARVTVGAAVFNGVAIPAFSIAPSDPSR